MCFSAEASFIASGALAGAGIFAVHRTIKSGDTSFLPVALFPWIFALQQFCEGFVWIFIKHNNLAAMNAFAFAFLFFALFLWPFYIPVALAIYDKPRKRLYISLSVIGVFLGLFLYMPYVIYSETLSPKVVDHSICYFIAKPWTSAISAIIYLALTVGAMLVSSNHKIRLLGIITGLSAIVAYYFYTFTFVSVWCFFSAVVSIYIGYIAYNKKNQTH